MNLKFGKTTFCKPKINVVRLENEKCNLNILNEWFNKNMVSKSKIKTWAETGVSINGESVKSLVNLIGFDLWPDRRQS